MCSIAGLINYHLEDIQSMRDSMIHRGPDFDNISQPEPNVALCHGRLAIIDLSERSNQPIENFRYHITYNGEIFNYKDFGRYDSDTLMLIDQITEKGFTDELLNRFNGQFAIACYDSFEHILHLAVDPFMQKPIHYVHEGMKFGFASTPGALTRLKDSWELDKDALESLWCLGSVTGERTLFKGISRLPGGYHATFNLKTGEFERHPWFTINPERVSDIEGLVYDAIDAVKVADVPVNIYLSGGIDSSLVASRFNKEYDQDAVTKAIHLKSEEQLHALHVASHFGLSFEVCEIDFNKEQVLEDYARKTGDCAMSAIQPYIVSEAAKQFGKVAIIANGADELFYGYNRTHDIGQMRHMMRPEYGGILHEQMQLYPLPEWGQEAIQWHSDFLPRWNEIRLFVQCDLNKTLDFASMCHSVEVRSPFLDTRLVNAALAIPYSEHHSDKYGGKHILKSMLAKHGFSKEFLTRPKLGFSLPPHLQKSNMPELEWCIEQGFLNRHSDWNQRDIQYISATAAAFKSWWKVWEHKLTVR